MIAIGQFLTVGCDPFGVEGLFHRDRIPDNLPIRYSHVAKSHSYESAIKIIL